MTERLCSVDECNRTHRGRGLCSMHLQRWHRTGEVGEAARRPNWHPGLIRRGPDHHNWSGDEITYAGAHLRVRLSRGSASGYTCTCGQSAAHWAYDHADGNEQKDERGRPYSPDPSHYLPLCVPCHSRFDAQARAAA